MKLAAGQFNATVGDFQHNEQAIKELVDQGQAEGVDWLVLPELASCGYPPYDLLYRPRFIDRNQQLIKNVAKHTGGYSMNVVVGGIEPNPQPQGRDLYNTAFVLQDGQIIGKFHKALLPTYDVFNEARYFEPERQNYLLTNGETVAVTICEDIWCTAESDHTQEQPAYHHDPIDAIRRKDIDLMVNCSASPFVRDKPKERLELLKRRAEELDAPLAMGNMVGGNDSVLFDGRSTIIDRGGRVIAQADAFEPGIAIADTEDRPIQASFPQTEQDVYDALIMGLRDYARKCDFGDVVIGLSGGIDSSMTTTLAVDALGAEHVKVLFMPSAVSSEESEQDAQRLTDNLGVELNVVNIEDFVDGAHVTLPETIASEPESVVEENVQARLRGLLLMAVANDEGRLVLSCGNKSELAVGYCTLYGDMTGGLGVLADVPKTLVYDLARWRNRQDEPVIPENVIDKEPTAELSPDQKDADELPPYELIDRVVRLFVEQHYPPHDVRERIGPEYRESVNQILRTLDHQEYKRKQGPPPLKITAKTLGAGRIVPIAHRATIE